MLREDFLITLGAAGLGLGVLELNPNIPVLRIQNEERVSGIVRQLLTYEGESGTTVSGYLSQPEKPYGKLPGVVALHSTSDNQMLHIAGVRKNFSYAITGWMKDHLLTDLR